jgi:toxin-antitoxin system PIN domain toxin
LTTKTPSGRRWTGREPDLRRQGLRVCDASRQPVSPAGENACRTVPGRWPVALSYLRIVTHPALPDAPLASSVAADNIDQFVSQPHVRLVGELDGFWPVYRRVADVVKPRGNLVPDAHLVPLMRQHGIATIWSHDRDFRKFEGLSAVAV